MNHSANDGEDFLQKFLDVLKELNVTFCAIGGLAVNAYAEPVVSLDLDVVVVADKLDELTHRLQKQFSVKTFPYGVNIFSDKSDLRIQIKTDSRYQNFLKRAVPKVVLGYDIPVAGIEDILKGKIWAYRDKERRPSKRQKDLADIFRLVEGEPALKSVLPKDLAAKIE